MAPRNAAAAGWSHTPSTPTLLWLAVSLPLVAWDMSYVVGGRPAGSNMITAAPTVVVKARGAETIDQPLFQPPFAGYVEVVVGLVEQQHLVGPAQQ